MHSENLAIVDLETTGTNPNIHDVLSVAVVPFEKTAEPLHIHVQCQGGKWSSFARENFKKFSEQCHEQAMAPETACQNIEDYLADTFADNQVTIIGHNIGLDVAFLRRLAYTGEGNTSRACRTARWTLTRCCFYFINSMSFPPPHLDPTAPLSISI